MLDHLLAVLILLHLMICELREQMYGATQMIILRSEMLNIYHNARKAVCRITVS